MNTQPRKYRGGITMRRASDGTPRYYARYIDADGKRKNKLVSTLSMADARNSPWSSKMTIEELQVTALRFNIEPLEWVLILSQYKTIERLRVALPLLQERHGHLRFKHRELAELVCASREKTTRAIRELKDCGFLVGSGAKLDGYRVEPPAPRSEHDLLF